MDNVELKDFVNKILKQKKLKPVRNFAKEFADGILFQTIFNILYDEKIDCRLTPSASVDHRLANWNRINSKSTQIR